MNVSLTPELAQFVKDQVARDNYASGSAVVQAGLRLLQAHGARPETFRQAVGQGSEQARSGQTTVGTEAVAGLSAWVADLSDRMRQDRIDALNLQRSRAVAARLRTNPSRLPRTLTALVAQLAADPTPAHGLLEQWRVLLERAIAGDPALLYEALEAKNDAAARLRQASPFSGVLSSAERDLLLADADARARLDELFTAVRRRLAASLTLPPDIAQLLGPEVSDDAFLDAAVELVARDNIDDEAGGQTPDRDV